MSTVAPAPPAANAIMSHPTNKHSPLVFAQRVKNRELKKLCVALAKSTPLSSSTSRPPLPKLTFRLNTQGQHVNNPQGGFDKSDEVLLRMMPYLLEGATAEVGFIFYIFCRGGFRPSSWRFIVVEVLDHDAAIVRLRCLSSWMF